jgi:hypothetical protein
MGNKFSNHIPLPNSLFLELMSCLSLTAISVGRLPYERAVNHEETVYNVAGAKSFFNRSFFIFYIFLENADSATNQKLVALCCRICLWSIFELFREFLEPGKALHN